MSVDDPKTVKNRVHVDLTSSAADRDREIDHLVALGARRGQTQHREPWILSAAEADIRSSVAMYKMRPD